MRAYVCVPRLTRRTILSVGAVGDGPIGTRSVHCPLWVARPDVCSPPLSPLPLPSPPEPGTWARLILDRLSLITSLRRSVANAARYLSPATSATTTVIAVYRVGRILRDNTRRADINYYSFRFFFIFFILPEHKHHRQI